MAPARSLPGYLPLPAQASPVPKNSTFAGPHAGAYNSPGWGGGLKGTSVDLIAMLVSDAGLSAIEPQWWNSSPLGCMLIGSQPRGGWQILQRTVQWGNDVWANCFGVKCDTNILYQYFACSIRNRLEVWDSDYFESPTLIRTAEQPVEAGTTVPAVSTTSPSARREIQPAASETTSLTMLEKGAVWTVKEIPGAHQKKDPPKQFKNALRIAWPLRAARECLPDSPKYSKTWQKFIVEPHRPFGVHRPTKLVDGSRGGQAFMCDILRPETHKAYTIEQQARMQLLSVLLVALGLTKSNHLHREDIIKMLDKDFQLNSSLGVIFGHLCLGLLVLNLFVAGFIISVFYALWGRNVYGKSAPFVVQLCSLLSWAFGATGLLMLGGNPRVEVVTDRPIPSHIRTRIFEEEQAEGCAEERATGVDEYGNRELRFGFLQGSSFAEGGGTCKVPVNAIEIICALDIKLVRTTGWKLGCLWFAVYLAISIVLQIGGATVATVASEVMAVVILLLTSLLRGQGISSSEKRMIPAWKMRPGAQYGATLMGKMQSRAATH